RSIERYTNGYLIVAGPSTPNTGDPYEFALFSWSGDVHESAQQLSTDLSGLVPEGIVELAGGTLTSTSLVQVLSDNGTTKWYSPLSDLEDKDLPEDNFRK